MPITVVTTFRIDREQGLRIASQAAPMIKRHGATAVRFGVCHSGAHTGVISVVVTFSNWQSYGSAVQGMYEDHAYQNLLGEAMKTGQLLDRSIMVMQEL